jgi:TIR domain
MPGFSSWGVFLSYRREDAAAYARLLQEQLSKSLPEARVFMDLDSIEAGLDFAEVIGEALDSCAVFVALIGPQWATLTDDKGRPRLYNPDDWVRLEVQTALDRGVRVIPVLVDGARPLREELLPAELHKLARLNALELSYGRYQYDADRLVELIQRVLAAAPGTGTGTGHQSSPAAAAAALGARHDVRPDGNAISEGPAEASQALPQVAGRWRDNFGYWLQIQQDGAAITTITTDASGNRVSQGQGTIKGRTITYTASGSGGQAAQGEFTVSPDGNMIQGRLDISMFGTPVQILNEVLVRA